MDPTTAQPVVEQFVIAFPTGAAWLIVGLICLIVLLLLIAMHFVRGQAIKFLSRMDAQDKALGDIKDLLASEVQKLRELYHGVDRRVVGVEAQLRFLGGKPTQRKSDDPIQGD